MSRNVPVVLFTVNPTLPGGVAAAGTVNSETSSTFTSNTVPLKLTFTLYTVGSRMQENELDLRFV